MSGVLNLFIGYIICSKYECFMYTVTEFASERVYVLNVAGVNNMN